MTIERIPGEVIDERAEKVLEQHCPHRLRVAGVTPVTQIADALFERSEIRLGLDAPLNTTNLTTHRVLGRFIFDPPTILIDRSLTGQDRRFNFTLAHELAHFFLHAHLRLEDDLIDTEAIVSPVIKSPTSPEEWIEWQANRFAGGLLMPKATFVKTLLEFQWALGIRSNLGRVFVESKSYSLTDYNSLRSRIGDVFDVSASAVESRLRTLGRLVDKRNTHQSVGDVLGLKLDFTGRPDTR